MSEVELWNDGWSFYKTDLTARIEEALQNQEDFKPVHIPHDWLIYDTGNLYESGCGWYQKELIYDGNSKECCLLRFDGVYMDSSIYVNRQKVYEWKNGYSAFDVDIAQYLNQGSNEIVVQVRHQAPNSRWYSGAGIYRDIWIKKCSSTYLPLDGTYVSMKALNDKDFSLSITTEIAGRENEEFTCNYSLWYEGKKVKDLGSAYSFVKSDIENAEVASIESVIEAPHRWDTESPCVYKLKVSLSKANTDIIFDTDEITVGFKTMSFDSNKGFILNGRSLKVHGVCEHHDLGCLGAAFYKEAMRRKFVLLRGMGVNAIRTSHNMPAKEVMNLADEMGFLVVSEAFDMWEGKKTEYDYARFFKEWAKRDVRSWVRRDRNHPSLMLWSIGNEIHDTHVSEYGQEITKRLIEYVKEHDSKENASITIGSNYMPWENARKCADLVKIAGYNYGEKYYKEHHKEYPDWVIYGSETASVVSSRGVYHFPLKQAILADEDEQCSALGNSSTSWGAKSVERCIIDDRDAKFTFGQFLWTGFDYIGEPTPYHTKNSYFGQLDTAGFPKDSYYIYKGQWTSAKYKEEPFVHLIPYWDFNEGQLIDVRVCSNCPSVELIVNGESMGIRNINHKTGDKLLGDWQVSYEKGQIEAVAYDDMGNILAKEVRKSFSDSAKIVLMSDKSELLADGEDLCFVTITTVDKDGNLVENAMDYVNVKVTGAGRLLGLDNGDSTDYDSYKGNVRKLFNGKLLAVIGTSDVVGEISISVTGNGLEGANMNLVTTKAHLKAGISTIIDSPKQKSLTDYVPVRKVELINLSEIGGKCLFTKENAEVIMEARIYPENASDTKLVWKVVNDSGIEIGFAKAEEISEHGILHRAKVTAFGDGEFRIRCMAEDSNGKITIISVMECSASGLGLAGLDPYGWISAGLYSESFGEVGNGNEKGIATARDGVSGVVFHNVNFGDYGSDEITVPVFALSGNVYPIEIWNGNPTSPESRLITSVEYQKPSKWNVYQEETWKLPERIKGSASLAFLLNAKVHIKGFCSKKYKKAYQRLLASECSNIYGDSFNIEEEAVTGIGNNVTLSYDEMDFGEEGVSKISICGRTPLAVNTIHVRFIGENDKTINQIIEFMGSEEDTDHVMKELVFPIDKMCGCGNISFIFLPGSNFDFHSFQFLK